MARKLLFLPSMDEERLGSRAARAWVAEVAAHTQPERIHWCDGSDEERDRLEAEMVRAGTLIALNPATHPASFLHRSAPNDVARTEHLTFISTPSRDDAGPTNNWMSPEDARQKVWPLFRGAMKGRTLYAVPYLMGPIGSPWSRVGVQVTDSPYVVLNLRIMTRMGRPAMAALDGANFVRGAHSLGDLSPDRRFIVHFPDQREIWSIGSGYGGNALLSKKCHALRIASAQARREGWLAEHMLIVGLTSPEGKTHYVAAAFPSACGKTNLAMLVPSLPGWKVDTVGDDICWMRVGGDGRLWAINPEAGMFGVAPGTSKKTNPNAMASLSRDVIFTNVALRADRSVWWEGLSKLEPNEELEDWQGRPWRNGGSTGPAAHPNARFTAALRQCPSTSESFERVTGVPISAIVFGGRRAKLAPLVYQARSFQHGVYVGATMVSETTAAATGAVGVPRNDPMAMLPFCGYNMADYFSHWLSVGSRLLHPPAIFHVNWFRTGEDDRFLWPGFGDNVRVLKWILERCDGTAGAHGSPIGHLPHPDSIDLSGLDLPPGALDGLLAVDVRAWMGEAARNAEFLQKFGDRLPEALRTEHAALEKRLREALQ